MSMKEENMDRMVEMAREHYNPPGETPREEMWSAIAAGLPVRDAEVVDLAAERERRRSLDTGHGIGWAVAAAAVLVIGIGIGRMTAPVTSGGSVATEEALGSGLEFAAAEHFGRTESLLTMVRADARSGRIDPAVGGWADGLLSETRLLIDASQSGDPAVEELLQDLELVLMQIVGLTGDPTMDESRARTELELALRGLEERELLPRLQAASPGRGLAGT